MDLYITLSQQDISFPTAPSSLFVFLFNFLALLGSVLQTFHQAFSFDPPVISKNQGTSAPLHWSFVLAFVFTEVKIHVLSKRKLTLWIFYISHLKMTRKQTHPRGPLLYLSQSEGVLAALWLSGGCQISSASTCQFTFENARRYLWWAVQSRITKTSYWKLGKRKRSQVGFFPSVFKESDESLIYIVSFIDKTCFSRICLSTRSGQMCKPSNRTAGEK